MKKVIKAASPHAVKPKVAASSPTSLVTERIDEAALMGDLRALVKVRP